jgi:glutaredoxin 3
MNAPNRAETAVAEAPVTLYTTRYCGYCGAAKRLLDKLGIAYHEVDITHDRALRDRLSHAFGGCATVPMIVVEGAFVGGYRELAELARGHALDRLVRARG